MNQCQACEDMATGILQIRVRDIVMNVRLCHHCKASVMSSKIIEAHMWLPRLVSDVRQGG